MSQHTFLGRQNPTAVITPSGDAVTYFISSLTGRLASKDSTGTVTDYYASNAPLLVKVRNQSGGSLVKGTPLAVVGTYAPGIPLVVAADKDDPALRPAIAVARSDILNGTTDDALQNGYLIGVDTSIFALTDEVVLGAGTFVRPPPATDPFTGEIQSLGSVTRVHATDGEIAVSIGPLDVVTAAQAFYTLEATMTGVVTGGGATRGGGLNVDVEAGTGFVASGGELTRVSWGAATVTVPAGSTWSILVDVDGVVQVGGPTYSVTQIILGFGMSDGGEVIILTDHQLDLGQLGLQFHNYGRDAIGPVNVSGQVTSIVGGLGLGVTSGTFYIDVHRLDSVAGSPIAFRYWYQDGLGGWTTVPSQVAVDPNRYDDGSGTLATLGAGQFKRDLLLCTVNDGETEFHVFYGQAAYASQVAAEAAANPSILAFANRNCIRLAAIVVQKAAVAIASVPDQRTRVGQFAAGNGQGDHASLADLGWTASGHTGAASTVAAFDAGGAAVTLPAGAAGTIAVGDAASAGSAAAFARSDHRHALPAPAAPADVTKAAASAGVATTVARADHKHDVSTAAPGTTSIGAAAAEGTASSLARSDHVHAVTAPAAPADVTKVAASAGASANMARADHKHDVSTAAPAATGVSTASSEGTATSLARSDHSHQSNTAATTIQPNDAAAVGTSGEPARADHKHAIATAAPGATSVGTASSDGAATSFARSDHVHQSNTAPSNVTKAAATIGTSGEPARADHKHDVSTAAPGTVTFGAATEGTATSLARSDHVHALTAPAAPANVTKAAAAAGTSANVAREDHKHDVTTAPTGSIGSANTEGTATSLARSDHNHQVTALTESSGPTVLTLGAVADGQVLVRSGATVVGKNRGATVQWGQGSISTTTTTRYLSPGFDPGVAPTTRVGWVAPTAGTIDLLTVLHDSTAGNGNSVVYTFWKQTLPGARASTTVTVSLATGAQGFAQDSTHSFTVAAGDVIDLEVTKAAAIGTSPANVNATCRFTPS